MAKDLLHAEIMIKHWEQNSEIEKEKDNN